MDAPRKTQAVDRDVAPARAGARAVPAAMPAAPAAALPLLRNGHLPQPLLRADVVLGLQRAAGNRAVARLVAPDASQPDGTEALAKTFGRGEEEEELEVLAKTMGQGTDALPIPAPPAGPLREPNGGCGPLCRCALCAADREPAGPPGQTLSRAAVSVEEVDPATAPSSLLANRDAVDPAAFSLLAKAGVDVKSGAAPSTAMPPHMGGYTYPERVDADIGAWFNHEAKTWRPIVKTLTGHFSLQARLIPGHAQITGVGGNTSEATYCDQCRSLANLGRGADSAWYVVEAIVAHERVHATRFKPALEDAEAAITSAIEAVTVPDEDSMTEFQAVGKLKADAAFQAAVADAQKLWKAAILVRVKGDHDGGGPTEAAERGVTEPLRKQICAHAAAKDWETCPACPENKKPWWQVW
jgi:hypothetical protein